MNKLVGILALVSWAGLFAIQNAEAMMTPKAGAIQTPNSIQEVQYYYGPYCKNVWKCGPYGCGWVGECYYPPSARGRCPRGYSIQDGICKPYRGY